MAAAKWQSNTVKVVCTAHSLWLGKRSMFSSPHRVVCLLLWLWILVHCCVAVKEETGLLKVAEGKLIKIAVLHRHGARTSAGIVDGSIRYDAPFGELTYFGEQQCRALGAFVRRRYAASLGLGINYTSAGVRSRSTAVQRVIHSGKAFLEGLFPDVEGNEANSQHIAAAVSKRVPYNAMDTSISSFSFPENDRDNLILSPWNGAPAFVFEDRQTKIMRLMRNITRTTLSFSEIEHGRRLMGLKNGTCNADPYLCVELLQDILMSNLSMPMGTEDSSKGHVSTVLQPLRRLGERHDATLLGMIPRLQYLQAVFVNTMLGYALPTKKLHIGETKGTPLEGNAYDGDGRDASSFVECRQIRGASSRRHDVFMRRAAKNVLLTDAAGGFTKSVGSLGQPLVNEILSFFENENHTSTVQHFAGHDYSLTAVFGALGAVTYKNFDDGCTVPRFADAIIWELHSLSANKKIVRIYKVRPTEEPASLRDLSADRIEVIMEPLSVLCGTAHLASDERKWTFSRNVDGECSLKGVRAFADTCAPTSPDRYCYASTSEMSSCMNSQSELHVPFALEDSCQRYFSSCSCTPSLQQYSPRIGGACPDLSGANAVFPFYRRPTSSYLLFTAFGAVFCFVSLLYYFRSRRRVSYSPIT